MRITLISGVLIVFVSLVYSCSNQEKYKVISERDESFNGHFVMPELPSEMEVCGEKIKLTDLDVRERLERELIVNTFYHSATILYLKRGNRFFNAIENVLEENGLPEDLKYLAVIESGLTQATSPSGARGFWQFMPATAEEYGLEVSEYVDERCNIQKSTNAAAHYLKDAYSKLGDWPLTMAAYNRGTKGVQTTLEGQKVENYFDAYWNSETARYVFRLMALKLIFESPEKYGFTIPPNAYYEPYKVKDVIVDSGIPNIIDWAIENKVNLKIVKKLNPWILRNTLPEGNFIVQLPREDANLTTMKN